MSGSRHTFSVFAPSLVRWDHKLHLLSNPPKFNSSTPIFSHTSPTAGKGKHREEKMHRSCGNSCWSFSAVGIV